MILARDKTERRTAIRRSQNHRKAVGAGSSLRPGTDERAFQFLHLNDRESKPRKSALTEIRGPYYAPMGINYLTDLLHTMGDYIDSLKFAGGSFVLMPERELQRIIDLAHEHNVLVSTGGFIERVLTQGRAAVDAYLQECKRLGFDIIELSAGFITIDPDDWLRLLDKVQKLGLKPKPELGIQFGAGGASSVEALEAQGTRDADWVIQLGKRFLDAGAPILMIESEGITENVKAPRTDIISKLANGLGFKNLMFEAADPEVFSWYIKNYGADVNLFVDHSQIVQLECLRQGLWGTNDVWGRIVTYKR
jgi:phosphosulfolactate synthase (CoM biosynthesis protein A)